MRCVDDGRARSQATAPVEQLDRADAVLGHAFLDLPGLLVGVDVEWQALGVGMAADLLEPVRGAGADGVGGAADADAVGAEVGELREVVGGRVLTEAGAAAAGVGAEQKRDLDVGLGGSVCRGASFAETEVVKLADGGVAG